LSASSQGNDPQNRLIGPHRRITDPKDRLGARLFGILMLVHMTLSGLLLLAMNYFWSEETGNTIWQDQDAIIVMTGLILILLAFLVLRCGYYRVAVATYVLIAATVSVVAPFVPDTKAEIGLLATAIIPILLSAIIFSYRWVFGILAFTTLVPLLQLLGSDMPARQKGTGFALLIVVIVVGSLLLVFRHHLESIERQRLQQISESQNAIRTSAERYRQLFETVTDGIMIAGSHGRILEVNEAGCRQLGYSRAEMLGLSLNDISARSADDIQRALRAVREKGHSFYQTAHKCKDGKTIPIELALTGIEYNGENAFLGVARDLTERQRIEDERQRLENQLQQAGKMESIGLLAGGVAHDFNNLLTTILGNVELALMDAPPDTPIGEMLQQIQQAGQSAAALTGQLLAFSRRQIIAPRVFDLNDLLSRMQKMLTRLIGEDVRLMMIEGPNLACLKADPGLVEQVIMNLTVNARDAMPNGGDLMIETANGTMDAEFAKRHPGSEPGKYVVLTVTDTGIGIPPELKERIFEPFFTTKPKGRGTGLGLATTYGAVKQSGGYIEVLSETGQGATFKVYFPQAPEQPENASPATEPLAHGTETLLVVEDDPDVRQIAVRILAQLGYRVLSAANGQEALPLAGRFEGTIHLLVSDVVMPGLNGRQLAEQLLRRRPSMKVLYTSGYTEETIVHRGVLEDGISFLTKPYTPRALGDKVRAVLDQPGA
jgi:two-component system, cell cycle sensor histidine kinase and response regulator CckA